MKFSRRVCRGFLGAVFVLSVGLATIVPVGATAPVAAAGGFTCGQLQSQYTHFIAAANTAAAKRQFVVAQQNLANASFVFDTATKQNCAWTQPAK